METKQCQNCKQEFTIEPDDFAFYEKIDVPPPTWCPECRIMRRVLWRNEKTMFRRKCDATGETVFSFLHPQSPIKIYEREYWWSDKWDPMEYGREYDFSKSFLEQFRELMLDVPWPSRSVVNVQNSDYCMNCSDLKNCYLIFHSSKNESCYYGIGIDSSRDCFDNLFIFDCELCYELFGSTRCYKTFYSFDCEDSQELYFCRDCVNCSNCIGSAGLRNKQYYIFNKPYSKEEYFKKLEEFKLGTHSGVLELEQQFDEFHKTIPVKYVHENKNVNISGDYIYNCKNVKQSYLMSEAEDCKYCQNIFQGPGSKDCYDYSFFGRNAQLVYEGSSVGIDVSNIKFSTFVYSSSREVEYSIMCPSSQNIFGCIGIRKKEYCILNKQYSKEAFIELRTKIIQHMNEMPYTDSKGRVYKYGEFFPPEFCPFDYNDTVAQEYFPLTKEQVIEQGFSWGDPEEKPHEPTISWKNLPDDIKSVDDSILKDVILCQSWDEDSKEAEEHNCTKAFKIVPQELQFCKNMNLPLPRRCFNSRHYERSKYRNPLKLWHRSCQCAGVESENKEYTNTSQNHKPHASGEHCPNEFETSYAPERKEIVYCEQCYQAEVV